MIPGSNRQNSDASLLVRVRKHEASRYHRGLHTQERTGKWGLLIQTSIYKTGKESSIYGRNEDMPEKA